MSLGLHLVEWTAQLIHCGHKPLVLWEHVVQLVDGVEAEESLLVAVTVARCNAVSGVRPSLV